MSRGADDCVRALQGVPGLTVRRDEPLALHCSFRLGGPARAWIEPSTVEQLSQSLGLLRGTRWMVIGGGTNALFHDRGFDGVVVCTRRMRGCTVPGSGMSALAGTPLAEAVRTAADHGLAGLEWLWGIPGTVGGAVAGNAGAFAQATFDRLVEVLLVGPDGSMEVSGAASFPSSYRHGGVPQSHVVAEARWSLSEGDPVVLREAMEEAMRRRHATQPWDHPTAGCVFRNPPGDSAGRLIEQAGLKGERIGGAVISTLHANFIVVDGPATSRDVRELIALVKDRVLQSAGIALDTELIIVEHGA